MLTNKMKPYFCFVNIVTFQSKKIYTGKQSVTLSFFVVLNFFRLSQLITADCLDPLAAHALAHVLAQIAKKKQVVMLQRLSG
mmetsp:Transcript_13026/g.15766  ORF Transcript_13026/g.15766 Transcript_13026/m.15766 type:complete len:82 (+) Transcript_13026:196-441(+)